MPTLRELAELEKAKQKEVPIVKPEPVKKESKPKIIKSKEESITMKEYTPTNDAIRTAYYLLFGRSTRTASKETLIAIRDQLERIL